MKTALFTFTGALICASTISAEPVSYFRDVYPSLRAS
jgi:hypothetical protein